MRVSINHSKLYYNIGERSKQTFKNHISKLFGEYLIFKTQVLLSVMLRKRNVLVRTSKAYKDKVCISLVVTFSVKIRGRRFPGFLT